MKLQSLNTQEIESVNGGAVTLNTALAVAAAIAAMEQVAQAMKDVKKGYDDHRKEY
jgi:lactobin A/cerein 7B family class IIb bacteriocin